MNMSCPPPSLSLFHVLYLPYTHVPVPVLKIYYILTSKYRYLQVFTGGDGHEGGFGLRKGLLGLGTPVQAPTCCMVVCSAQLRSIM